MKKIVPYKTKHGALKALDNGGRFYNLLTDADDGKIASAELAKVAGVFTDKQKMFLYLDMALAELDPGDADAVIQSMSLELRSAYSQYRPAHYTPHQATKQGKASASATVTGIPHYVKSSSDFVGFIMIPIVTGKATTFTMVPIIDYYDVYEVRDMKTSHDFLIAHARGSKELPQVPTIVGGILKKLQGDKNRIPKHKLYLEAVYYSVVSASIGVSTNAI